MLLALAVAVSDSFQFLEAAWRLAKQRNVGWKRKLSEIIALADERNQLVNSFLQIEFT